MLLSDRLIFIGGYIIVKKMIFGAVMALAIGIGVTQVSAATIHDAAVVGDVATVREELNNGVDVNAQNTFRQTALMLGLDRLGRSTERVGQRFKQRVEQLCDVPGIDLNAKDNFGDTALILAVRENKTNIVRQLLQAGADIAVEFEQIDRGWIWTSKSKYTVLQYAQKKGYTETAKAIEDHIFNTTVGPKTKSAAKVAS
jgi:ankyrin repeat protein